MNCSDEQRKRRQRAAYEEYARLQWQFYRLAHDHPARAALAEAVRVAEQHWRSLMLSLGSGSAFHGQLAALGDPALGTEEAAVSLH